MARIRHTYGGAGAAKGGTEVFERAEARCPARPPSTPSPGWKPVKKLPSTPSPGWVKKPPSTQHGSRGGLAGCGSGHSGSGANDSVGGAQVVANQGGICRAHALGTVVMDAQHGLDSQPGVAGSMLCALSSAASHLWARLVGDEWRPGYRPISGSGAGVGAGVGKTRGVTDAAPGAADEEEDALL